MVRKIGRRPALMLFVAVFAIATCAVAFGAGAAGARSSDNSIYVVTTPGTNAPPPTLGQFFMTPYPLDSSICAFTDHAPSPSGAYPLYFSYSVIRSRVPTCWATWSNGYSGDVYWNDDEGDLGLQVPSGTRAFYLYVEPDAFATETFTVTGYGPGGFAQATFTANGSSGASYVGFYSPNGTVGFINVHDSTSGDFAVGEFGLNYSKLRRVG